MTSGGNRSERSFRGFASLGRPRQITFFPRYRSAPSIHSSVIPDASSGSGALRTKPFRFTLMTVPHTDYMASRTPRSPDESDQSSVKPACRDEARFTMSLASVRTREMGPGAGIFRPAHIQAPFPQHPLLGMADNARISTVATNSGCVNRALFAAGVAGWLTTEQSGRGTRPTGEASANSLPALADPPFHSRVARADAGWTDELNRAMWQSQKERRR